MNLLLRSYEYEEKLATKMHCSPQKDMKTKVILKNM